MNSKNFNCRLDLPYPDISGVKPDAAFAQTVSALYAGRFGEFTAISSYSYQHIVLKDAYSYLSDVLECISIVEMRHFELLGELICSLGGDPVIGESRRRRTYYWSGSFVSYAKQPDRILSENIRAEQRAIAEYSAAAKAAPDEESAALLRRIILDEEHHVEIFRQLQGKYS